MTNNLEPKKVLAQAGPWVKHKPRPLDFEAWCHKYKPHFNGDEEPYDGLMYETFGDDFAEVRDADPRNVWTIIEAEGTTVLCAGLHHVNRQGYFITEVPWTDETETVVMDDEADDDDRFTCAQCHEIHDIEDSVRRGQDLICLECAQR